MNFISIDFSLNSPGICIFTESNFYHFIGYLKPGTGTKAEQKIQGELNLLDNVQIVHQPDWTNNADYSKSEMIKVLRHSHTSKTIIDMIIEITGADVPCIVSFEGSSYGSSGGTNNIIDLAAGAAILKMQMIERLEVVDMLTIAPSTIKKFINKGNMNKEAIWPFFLDNKYAHNIPLVEYCRDNIGYDNKKVPKPIDDLIDAFFLTELIKASTQYIEKNPGSK